MSTEAQLTPQEVTRILSSVGNHRNFPTEDIKMYPVFLNRIVFRSSSNGDTVIKIRPEPTERARLETHDEVKKASTLLDFYQSQGIIFPKHLSIHEGENYVTMDMPYMGETITSMAEQKEYRDLGYRDEGAFTGFSGEKVENLLVQLRKDLDTLKHQYGLVHGDLFHQNGQRGEAKPNNIVYNTAYDRLLLIDAEALTTATVETITTRDEQLRQTSSWMHERLVV